MKTRANCQICGWQSVCLGGYWTFMPAFCCQSKDSRKEGDRRGKDKGAFTAYSDEDI